jgi:N-acetylmuramic acid 6-phosphate etherase
MKETEASSKYDHLEKMSVMELLQGINAEDKGVALAVERALPQIEALCIVLAEKIVAGGRLFYLGAGTSGRLGIVDASECPPTFGVEHGRVIGLIAGGDTAIRKAVEFAEDSPTQGWDDLCEHMVSADDVVIGIAASGTTPYVVEAIKKARSMGITTACITCCSQSPLAAAAAFPVEVVTGPEFVTGSTRMKAGTAQKLVLNMISTTAMIRLGRVKGNRMVDMQLSNNKLIDRGCKMVMDALHIDVDAAKKLLLTYGSVRSAIENGKL